MLYAEELVDDEEGLACTSDEGLVVLALEEELIEVVVLGVADGHHVEVVDRHLLLVELDQLIEERERRVRHLDVRVQSVETRYDLV